jgi:ferredoxin
MDTSLRHSPGEGTPEYDTVFDFSDVLGVVRAAERCNGSGDCRKGPLAGGTMCPSYMVTREEQHTTRARANILRQILTSPADAERPFNSDEIKEVMDLCLSCKACKSECPSSVDMTRLKAEFLQQYHDANGVPLRSRMIAHFADSARLASLAPWLYNAILQTPSLRRIANRLLGFHPDRSMPRLNKLTLHRWLKKRTPLSPLRGERLGRVHLFCDEFTNFNDLKAGIATVELLELLGYEVNLPDHVESGRASLSKGLVRRAKGFANENVRQLSGIVSAEEPLIGIEPSAILPRWSMRHCANRRVSSRPIASCSTSSSPAKPTPAGSTAVVLPTRHAPSMYTATATRRRWARLGRCYECCRCRQTTRSRRSPPAVAVWRVPSDTSTSTMRSRCRWGSWCSYRTFANWPPKSSWPPPAPVAATKFTTVPEGPPFTPRRSLEMRLKTINKPMAWSALCPRSMDTETVKQVALSRLPLYNPRWAWYNPFCHD